MLIELVKGGGAADVLGATVTPNGVNFAVYSETASAILVCLFDAEDREIFRAELDGHEGAIHYGLIVGIGQGARYGLRAEGRFDPGQGYHFDRRKLLVDPYARWIDRPFRRHPALLSWPETGIDTAPLVPKARVWQSGAKPLAPRRRAPEMVYELNVRGYTKLHPDVPEGLRGTLAGLMEAPILKHLERIGADCVELLPVAAWVDDNHLPGLGLTNAWGYNPITYFAPDPRLAPNGPHELRALTELYRRHGISVVLDVVYNHTGESDDMGPVLSLKGLDALTYYRHVARDGRQVLINDAGTGNTLACDHPAVQRLVIESLRHWVEEEGVSGFRFDLATVLGREPGFNPQAQLLQAIKADPVLSRTILIAEPWDIGPGGYQLGRFGKPFHEWNDTYRDEIRRFWRGDGRIGALASKVAGSAEIFDFDHRRPSSGVNFLAAHDGFTLIDLVSYQHKHNEANGEHNRDGHGENSSWNCGVEGPSSDPAIAAARLIDMRALLATLMVSRGLPMLQQGDEMGRTQQGNNNAYAQDNAITWVDWARADTDLIDYVAALVALRRAHPALHQDHFLTGHERHGSRDVVWLHPEGREMTTHDWETSPADVLGMQLTVEADRILVWFNRAAEPVVARLPDESNAWGVLLSSNRMNPSDPGAGRIGLPPRSVTVLGAPQGGTKATV